MSSFTPTRKLSYSLSSDGTHHAVEQWRSDLSEVVETQVPERARFHARLSVGAVGHALFMQTQSSSQVMTRSPGLIRANEFDHVSICVVQSGEHRGDLDGASAVLRPGDVFITHHARPSTIAYSDFRCLRLHIPRFMAPSLLRNRNVHGLVLKGQVPGARLLARHVEQAWASLTELAPGEIATAAEAAFLMAAGSVGANTPLRPDHREAIGRTVKQAIYAFIDERLGDPRLGPDTICACFNISKSKLYRLFENEGGIASLVMARRLDACWRKLRTDGREAGPIHGLAYAHGFQSDASFSRAFRRRFGASPSEVRDSFMLRYGYAGDGVPPQDDGHIMGLYRNLAARRPGN